MPIYEYVCSACGQSFEKLVLGGRKMRETAVVCPNCCRESQRKQVTLVGAMGLNAAASLASSAASCAPSG